MPRDRRACVALVVCWRFKEAAGPVDILITMVALCLSTPAAGPFLAHAPRDLAAWLACFDPAQLPVLRSTALGIEELQANEDGVDAHLLASSMSNDPLMILKLLAHVADVRRGREGTDAETATEALVMLGITPFFRRFARQPIVEDLLDGNEVATAGFERVLARSRRAGRFALAMAVQRMDHDVSVIHEAALLHDFVELLLWVTAPDLAAEMASRMRADPSLRSATLQAAVLNIKLDELQHALMRQWRLPQLLVSVVDPRQERVSAQARSVQLAVRLARHTADGWENPALKDDVLDIAALLNMNAEPTLAILRDIDDA
jgi:HD-like signal output (HDOD) protein